MLHIYPVFIFKCYPVTLLVFTKSRFSYRKYVRDHEILSCYLHLSNPVVLVCDKQRNISVKQNLCFGPNSYTFWLLTSPCQILRSCDRAS
jgi:hypothetical protein